MSQNVWEEIFKNRSSWGYYPPEELIRFIAKYYYDKIDRKSVKILEVGCGPGGGPSWYIAREGFSFYGIDGSSTAIEKAKKRFQEEKISGQFTVGNIADLPWENETFDCVIDIACLQHNSEQETMKIIKEIYRVLKKEGRHFSLATKKGCWGDGKGEKLDNTSFKEILEGPFAHMGVVRFATQESLKNLYKDFSKFNLEYSIRSVNQQKNEISNYIIDCQK